MSAAALRHSIRGSVRDAARAGNRGRSRRLPGGWLFPGRNPGRAAWPGPRTPRQMPAFRYRKEKSSERPTVCWRELDSNLRFRARAGTILPVRFVADSLLEGDGFEPSVPRPRRALLSGPPLVAAKEQAAARSALRFSPISPARRAIPSSQAGVRFEQIVACCAARRLPPVDGTTHIYLRSSSAQPTIR